MVALWCERFSPLVGIEESDAAESLWLELAGLDHLAGGESALAETILDEFAQAGLITQAALAGTPGAAWALAHFAPTGDRSIGRSQNVANEQPSGRKHGHVSLRTTERAGLRIVPPGNEAKALAPLPVEALRLSEETIHWLHLLGIRTLGLLAGIDRAELASRLGPEWCRRWDQATGKLFESIPACRPTPEFSVRRTFEDPVSDRKALESILELLLRQLARSLERRGRGAMRLRCRLDSSEGPPAEFLVGLFEASASAGHLFPLVCLPLERMTLAAPVEAVTVEAVLTAPLERTQATFFDMPARRRSRELASLVERLAGRLGPQAVLRTNLIFDAQPEAAFRYARWLDGAGRARSIPIEHLPPRPLQLFRTPLAVTVEADPTDGPPSNILWQGHWHEILHRWGPERIETGWWRGPRIARDYYRIETSAGTHFWLFRRLGDGRWFLHGAF